MDRRSRRWDADRSNCSNVFSREARNGGGFYTIDPNSLRRRFLHLIFSFTAVSRVLDLRTRRQNR